MHSGLARIETRGGTASRSQHDAEGRLIPHALAHAAELSPDLILISPP
jgi:hypothetical protein